MDTATVSSKCPAGDVFTSKTATKKAGSPHELPAFFNKPYNAISSVYFTFTNVLVRLP
jgi:hypothetical protein